LARHVEDYGYKRYWVAEHHDLPGMASSATTLLVQHLAAAIRTLRVGSGGIMLPNHSPLMVAEQFGTLATLFPGRIDLGISRAPGSAGAAIRCTRDCPSVAAGNPEVAKGAPVVLSVARVGR